MPYLTMTRSDPNWKKTCPTCTKPILSGQKYAGNPPQHHSCFTIGYIPPLPHTCDRTPCDHTNNGFTLHQDQA